MNGLDSIITLNQLLVFFSGIIVFIILIFLFIKGGQPSIDRKFKNAWFYIPVITLILSFILDKFLKNNFNEKVTNEIIEKIDKTGKVLIPNTKIVLDKDKITPVKSFTRFTSDSIYKLELYDYYFIRLERTLEDSNNYWIFVEKYMSTNQSDPAAIFRN